MRKSKPALPPKATVRGYVRVSSDQQAKSGLSTSQQRKQCLDVAKIKANELRLQVGKVYLDDGVSATRYPLLKRPQGWQIDQDLIEGDHVVISKLDRAFRSQHDCVITLRRWTERGVIVHLLDLGVDTSTPVGRMMVGILSCFAEFESHRIGERIRDAFAAMRRLGRSVNGAETIGYKLIGKKLTADPGERKVIKRIRTLRDQGLFFREVAEKINGAGCRRRQKNNRDKGGKWNAQACWRAYHAKL